MYKYSRFNWRAGFIRAVAWDFSRSNRVDFDQFIRESFLNGGAQAAEYYKSLTEHGLHRLADEIMHQAFTFERARSCSKLVQFLMRWGWL